MRKQGIVFSETLTSVITGFKNEGEERTVDFKIHVHYFVKFCYGIHGWNRVSLMIVLSNLETDKFV